MASFAVVPKDASTDTETQSDVPCVTPEPQQANQKRRVLVSFVAAAALMAAGAAVAATKNTSAAQSMFDVEDAQMVSLQSCTKAGIGCADWETAKIGNLLTFATEAECTLQCTDNPACLFSNFQPGDCSDAEGAYKGACYLFSACTEENNTCWDLTPKACSASTTTTTGR